MWRALLTGASARHSPAGSPPVADALQAPVWRDHVHRLATEEGSWGRGLSREFGSGAGSALTTAEVASPLGACGGQSDQLVSAEPGWVGLTLTGCDPASDLNQWVSFQATGGGGSEGGAEGQASPVGSWMATVRSLAAAFGG